MKFAAIRMACRFLIFSMMMLSFQTVQAGMIGTDQVASATGAQAERNAVLSLMNRSEVASQLQALGLDPNAAKDRLAALTDEEVRTLAGQLNSLPAGADSGWWIAAVLLVGVLVWYVYYRR
ncbi:MAG: hypothetical protein A3G24_08680 [Betaproteobacteria bacterium RIFCSPLOWO2_12_FULL_62_13]|nr:MAG: hypothetical protein A3G24_08680 [Betaproteobacteria bacterium RIFCSPLOWO2_12_FULL_62_13]